MKKNGSPEADALLKRGYLLLDDGEWEKARKYFSRSLDLDPENAQAYLGRLMSHLKVKNKEDLKEVAEPFDHSKNYANIMRFGDTELKDELQGYNEHIKERNIEKKYTEAKRLMDNASTENSYIKAREAFKDLGGYKDSGELIKQCNTKIDEIQTKNKEEAAKLREKSEKRNKKILIIAAIGAAALVFIILLINVIMPQVKYNNAVSLMDAGNYDKAEAEFRELGDFSNSPQMIEEVEKSKIYNHAISLMSEGNYYEAVNVFKNLGDYRDSIEQFCEIEYNNAVELMNSGEYQDAIDAFEELNWDYSIANTPEDNIYRDENNEVRGVGNLVNLSYKDSNSKIKECESLLSQSKREEIETKLKSGNFKRGIRCILGVTAIIILYYGLYWKSKREK